ncbi:hypothetical protein [Dapis sp. BLCC M229]|uniref:hypothetical protein n=1 Tax=Dapis sp. BLCC M229 TaxID=3400188 RepID=UPI003CF4B9DC
MNKNTKAVAKMWKIMGSAIPVLMFVNQLLSYSLAIELEQGNIKRIEFRKEHNRLIEKIIDFFPSEKNDEEEK